MRPTSKQSSCSGHKLQSPRTAKESLGYRRRSVLLSTDFRRDGTMLRTAPAHTPGLRSRRYQGHFRPTESRARPSACPSNATDGYYPGLVRLQAYEVVSQRTQTCPHRTTGPRLPVQLQATPTEVVDHSWK